MVATLVYVCCLVMVGCHQQVSQAGDVASRLCRLKSHVISHKGRGEDMAVGRSGGCHCILGKSVIDNIPCMSHGQVMVVVVVQVLLSVTGNVAAVICEVVVVTVADAHQ